MYRDRDFKALDSLPLTKGFVETDVPYYAHYRLHTSRKIQRRLVSFWKDGSQRPDLLFVRLCYVLCDQCPTEVMSHRWRQRFWWWGESTLGYISSAYHPPIILCFLVAGWLAKVFYNITAKKPLRALNPPVPWELQAHSQHIKHVTFEENLNYMCVQMSNDVFF